ncbi:uncharacterized protein K02A2.6-like [Eupeodes corollae]|uniref:uncharacterized protein K02A2.6-like n=1 Tax=Eupeodes corollae TaxID=290404 RepID=UPI00248F79D7|nr:uncharacterized protein K02A2.6-like [Eupeodes corollae]
MGTKQHDAFQKLKTQLAKIPTLSYFNPKKRIRLIADASPVALGAVLLQFEGNEPQVVSFANSFSRLCNLDQCQSFDERCEQNICTIIEETVPKALTIFEISENSNLDPELVEAMNTIKTGNWNTNTNNRFFPFRLELSTVVNILLQGVKLVIPCPLRSKVLELAHEGHPGEIVMKRRVLSKVWWPLIDRDVEKWVKKCHDCLLVSRPINPVPMKRHQFPERPWICLARDLLGPFPNNDFVFAVIDYYSRYHELKFIKKITSSAIIEMLEELFSRLGYPESIKADNGRQFVSQEFKNYCENNNIKLITSPPYWPQANGEIENLNRSILKRLQMANTKGLDYKKEILKFILMYNVTPHGTTGKAPSELLFNRVIRDKIPSIQDVPGDVLDSETRDLDSINKEKGKQRADIVRGAKSCDVNVGDKVVLKNVVFPNKLTPQFGPEMYEVIQREGSDVVVKSNDRTLRRNLKEYIAMIKNTMNKKPKIIRSDRGEEYTGSNMVDYLKQEGIIIQYTTGYSPEQNGVAERKNRSLVEMSQYMLSD